MNQTQLRREIRDKEVSKKKSEVEKRVNNQEQNDFQSQEQQNMLESAKQAEKETKHIQNANALMEEQNKMDKEKLKLEDYNQAMQRIKDSTGVSDVNEIIQKFLTQNDTLNNLNELKQENELKILILNEERGDIKKQLEYL